MKLKLIFLSLLFSISLSARQTDDGESFFNNKQYAKARTIYENYLKKRPNDYKYNYQYARCCYELKDFENAITHFEMSGKKYPLRDLYLGELYFNSYRFDQSVVAYQTYIATLKPDDPKIPEYQQKVKRAENAALLLTRVDDVEIVDSMVVNKSEFLKFYKFSSELGTLSQELLKMINHRTVDKIKYTTQRQDRVYFSDSIHSQMDIFTSFKLLDTWSKPVPISNVINTSANENYPFLLLDGVTVYFASDGENSIGGYDLFVTRLNPSTNTYLTPENIGFPFNSPANDYMMVIDEQRKLGWFATDRNQPAGKVMIYTFVPNSAKIIIHSDDKNYIRQAAQLKTYRKGKVKLNDSDTSSKIQVQESHNQINFVVNDSIVYTSLDQFKSKEALKCWNEYQALIVDHQSKINELTELRTKYNSAENDSIRQSLSPEILKLEKSNVELEKSISIKKVQIRNEEIKFLQNGK